MSETHALSALDSRVGGLAHEMKNPLTAIRTFVQLVRHKHDDRRFLEKFERIVLQELDRVDGILDELLQFGRPVRAQWAAVDLADMVRRAAEVYLEYAGQQRIVITTEIASPLPRPVADAELLNRAFANLTLNAMQAMPRGGALLIICRPVSRDRVDDEPISPHDPRAHAIEVVFQDTGVGIPPEQLDVLFRPFHTTKAGGTGLGLALTRKIIETHGGTIRVTSRVGHGTTVSVRLPC